MTSSHSDEGVGCRERTKKYNNILCESDVSLISTQGFSSTLISQFSLKSYPSIVNSRKLVRSLVHSRDVDGFCAACEVFLACFRTIVQNVKQVFKQQRISNYETGPNTEELGTFMHSHILAMKGLHKNELEDQLNAALDIVDRILSDLCIFLGFAEDVTFNKPLPSLPLHTIGPQKNNIEPLNSCLPAICSVKPCESNDYESSSGIGNSTIHLYDVTDSDSSATLIDEIFFTAPKDFSIVGNNRFDDTPYLTGYSDIRLNENGRVTAASFSALVRLITSKYAASDLDIYHIFFGALRLFSTPMQALDMIIERFDEGVSARLNSTQSQEWLADASNIPFRCAKTILLWLRDFWQEDDAEILERLREFTDSQLADIVVAQHDLIVRELDVRKVERHAAMAVEAPNPNHQILCILGQHHYRIPIAFCVDTPSHVIEWLDSPPGREEFARQVTVKASELFQRIEPVKAVMYWHKYGEKVTDLGVSKESLQPFVNFGYALGAWVTQTILDCEHAEERARMVCFWLKVAAMCLKWKDFWTSYTIHNGIAHGAINRLKMTIMLVPDDAKDAYHHIAGVFSTHKENYAQYRKALNDNEFEPCVPVLVPLFRDILHSDLQANCKNIDEDKTLIVLQRFRVSARITRVLKKCGPYTYEVDERFQSWFRNCLHRFQREGQNALDNNFYVLSKEREARGKPEDAWKHYRHPQGCPNNHKKVSVHKKESRNHKSNLRLLPLLYRRKKLGS